MASDEVDNFDKNIENLKCAVKQSFARIYAALKARELKTLRQLDALRKQSENNKDKTLHCVQNIHINYDNECTLLDNITIYGAIDFEKLNFDSNTFTLEDYVSPNDDHMYSYKTIQDLSKTDDNKELEAIEEAALKQITKTDNCTCCVSIKSEDVSKQFREMESDLSSLKKPCDSVNNPDIDAAEVHTNDNLDISEEEYVNEKKIDPTEDWLNSIKGQTETEPSQVTDVMEHSTITCS